MLLNAQSTVVSYPSSIEFITAGDDNIKPLANAEHLTPSDPWHTLATRYFTRTIPDLQVESIERLLPQL